jgi:hypothetical protein
MTKKEKVIQIHHLIYENEAHKQKAETVRMYKGEHWAITQLQRRTNFSKGFIKSLRLWLLFNADKAQDI